MYEYKDMIRVVKRFFVIIYEWLNYLIEDIYFQTPSPIYIFYFFYQGIRNLLVLLKNLNFIFFFFFLLLGNRN